MAEQADESSGIWRTIDGTHVLLNGGKIVDGPAALKGKPLHEAHEHAAKQRDREAAGSRRESAYQAKQGNAAGAEKHAHIAKFHEDKAKELRAQGAEHKAVHATAEAEMAGYSRTPEGIGKAAKNASKKAKEFAKNAEVFSGDKRAELLKRSSHYDQVSAHIRDGGIAPDQKSVEFAAGLKNLSDAKQSVADLKKQHTEGLAKLSEAEGRLAGAKAIGEARARLEGKDKPTTKRGIKINEPEKSPAPTAGDPEDPTAHTAAVLNHVTTNRVGGAHSKSDFLSSAQFGADKSSYPQEVEHSLRQSVAAGHIEAIPREDYKTGGRDPKDDHKLINIGGKAIQDFRLTQKGRRALQDAGHVPRELSADIISLDASAFALPLEFPGGLDGLPTFEEIPDENNITGKDEKGAPIFGMKQVPVRYYRKELIRTPADGKKWTHRGLTQLAGEPMEFEITTQVLDQTVDNFRERQKAGILPNIPDRHEERMNAAANNGHIIGLERKGNGLYAKMKVVGTASIEKTLKNDVTVHLVNGNNSLVKDAYGKQQKGWVLHHVALTPNPNQPHLGPFEKIAASADAPALDVPVFRYAVAQQAAPSRRRPKMTPELATQARTALGIEAAVEDDKFNDLLAERAISLSAEVITLRGQRDDAQALAVANEAKAKDAAELAKTNGDKVLALSAEAPRKPDAFNRALAGENIRARREIYVGSGVISEAGAKLVDGLILSADGTPNDIALSLSGEAKRPFASHLWDVIAKLSGSNGITTGAAPRDVTQQDPNAAISAAAEREGDEKKDKPTTPEEKKKMLGSIGLQPVKC